MRAISLHQPWATWIAQGKKTIESRTWSVGFLGPIVICSTKQPKINGHLCGYALCTARIVDCRKFTKDDLEAACMKEMPDYQLWAWVLENITPIEPFSVKGTQGFYEVDDSLIRPPQTANIQQDLKF